MTESLSKGWPRPGTLKRDWLDQIYWGDEPLGTGWVTAQPPGHYYMPRVINQTGAQIATWREAGDILPDHMAQFVHEWEDWRRRRGHSVEARRRKHQGRVRVRRVTSRTEIPMPTPIARWEQPRDRRRRQAVRPADWDFRPDRYPRW